MTTFLNAPTFATLAAFVAPLPLSNETGRTFGPPTSYDALSAFPVVAVLYTTFEGSPRDTEADGSELPGFRLGSVRRVASAEGGEGFAAYLPEGSGTSPEVPAGLVRETVEAAAFDLLAGSLEDFTDLSRFAADVREPRAYVVRAAFARPGIDGRPFYLPSLYTKPPTIYPSDAALTRSDADALVREATRIGYVPGSLVIEALAPAPSVAPRVDASATETVGRDFVTDEPPLPATLGATPSRAFVPAPEVGLTPSEREALAPDLSPRFDPDALDAREALKLIALATFREPTEEEYDRLGLDTIASPLIAFATVDGADVLLTLETGEGSSGAVTFSDLEDYSNPYDVVLNPEGRSINLR